MIATLLWSRLPVWVMLATICVIFVCQGVWKLNTSETEGQAQSGVNRMAGWMIALLLVLCAAGWVQ